jgi:streptomycin 6-kinase
VLPVERADGTEAVLKVQIPHRESTHEAAALEVWGGDGAVRLLEHDAGRSALLIERCRPGTPLHEIGMDAALDVAVGLFPRLWKPAGEPFLTLAEEAAWWIETLQESVACPADLLEVARSAVETLVPTQPEAVLVHQDLHALNVISASREPWLVIDPKPLVGERAFGIAALVRGGELGESREAMTHRLDRLTSELGIDRERARLWTLVQTLAWGVDEQGDDPGMIAIARWLDELGDT